MWCGALYYFARTVDLIIRLHISYPAGTSLNAKVGDLQTWSYVGCGVTALNVYVVLLKSSPLVSLLG